MSCARVPSLILASGSPQRRAILAKLDLDFTVRVTNVPEDEHGDPAEVALVNALRKARAARRPGESELVIACDTIVALDGQIYGKPGDEAVARETLGRLGGRTHSVLGGLAVIDEEGVELTALAVTEVTFRELDERMLDWYVGTGEWRERSGGYAIQGAGAALVRSVRGSVENVVGLPLAELLDLCPRLLVG